MTRMIAQLDGHVRSDEVASPGSGPSGLPHSERAPCTTHMTIMHRHRRAADAHVEVITRR